MDIAFLHTSKTHVDRFEKIIKLVNNTIKTKHYVNEDLLKHTLLTGKVNTVGFKKYINEIKKDKCNIIICNCSTYGEEAEKLASVYRIDRPIAEYIIEKHDNIGLVFTAHSTKNISKKLLYKIAENKNKKITIIECDCSEYWKCFEEGNLLKYETKIAAAIKNIEQKTDVIFLAQASMQGATKHLVNFNKEIVSSPEYGIKQIIKSVSLNS